MAKATKDKKYNVKTGDHEYKELTEEEYDDINANDRDHNGRFVKNNRFGQLQKEKRSAKERMSKEFRHGEEIDVLRKLLKSKTASVQLAAAKLILEYKHGRPTQVIEQEVFNHDNPSDVPEEVQDLLDSLGGNNGKED